MTKQRLPGPIRSRERDAAAIRELVGKYGPEAGSLLYHVLLSQATHAGVSKPFRHKFGLLEGRITAMAALVVPLPLFQNIEAHERALACDVRPETSTLELVDCG